MKYIFIILTLAFLLVLPMCLAKDLGNIQAIDWKATTFTIKDDGVYNKDTIVVEEDKAEIWIDKKVDDTYYIDSLVNTDTIVKVELYYEIPPDYIDYFSHNKKYTERFEWGDYVWVDCTEKDCVGGTATMLVTLEYATGSNTFTAAISGATWMDDGVTITLIENTDYTQSAGIFTISNINYAWRNVAVSYDYERDTSLQTSITDIGENVSDVIPWIGIILLVIAASIVLVLVIINFKKGRI